MVSHHGHIRRDFPSLAAGALLVSAPPAPDRAAELAGRHLTRARERRAGGPESRFPETQAWRRACTAMGVRATQHRHGRAR